jgi:hypothetical protein
MSRARSSSEPSPAGQPEAKGNIGGIKEAGRQDREERFRRGPQETGVQGVVFALWAVMYL